MVMSSSISEFRMLFINWVWIWCSLIQKMHAATWFWSPIFLKRQFTILAYLRFCIFADTNNRYKHAAQEGYWVLRKSGKALSHTARGIPRPRDKYKQQETYWQLTTSTSSTSHSSTRFRSPITGWSQELKLYLTWPWPYICVVVECWVSVHCPCFVHCLDWNWIPDTSDNDNQTTPLPLSLQSERHTTQNRGIHNQLSFSFSRSRYVVVSTFYVLVTCCKYLILFVVLVFNSLQFAVIYTVMY